MKAVYPTDMPKHSRLKRAKRNSKDELAALAKIRANRTAAMRRYRAKLKAKKKCA